MERETNFFLCINVAPCVREQAKPPETTETKGRGKMFKPGQTVYRIYFHQSTKYCLTCGRQPQKGVGEWQVLHTDKIWSRRVTETEKIMGEAEIAYSFNGRTDWYPDKDVFAGTVVGQVGATCECARRNR